MAKEKSKAEKSFGNKPLYIGVGIFTVLWFISTVFVTATQKLNYNWDNFILNFPGKLYKVTSFFTGYDLGFDYQGNRYSFGK
nr:hypothetical protein [Elusimicrobiota bacterium]